MIVRLPPEVYQKIAAGEVVERPLSVVKELVENSIDAGARRIEVELREGGRKLIRVSDDGTGIPLTEVELAFERHSTSKLSKLEDLDRISTLGFRGEALASIVEVADLQVVTSNCDSGEGILLCYRQGRLSEKRSVATPRGTRIEVHQLFANFPVRLKFLKSEKYETRLIADFLQQFFLFHYQVGIVLKTEKRTLFTYQPAADFAERVYQIFGKELLSTLNPLNYRDQDGWQISGMISKINQGVSKRELQSFLVNQRLVRDRLLAASTNGILKEFFEKGQRPVIFLDLQTPAGEIDVNVHPQKLEIRFRNQQKLFSALRHALLQAIGIEERTGIFEMGNNYESRKILHSPQSSQPVEKIALREIPLVFPNREEENRDNFRLIGQFLNSYLLVEKDNRLYIVDQHNAEERIIYEHLLEKRSAGKVSRVRTLLPLVLQLSPAETTLVETHLTDFEELGFELELFSAHTISIKAYPDYLSIDTVREIFFEIIHLQWQDREELWQKALSTVACKRAIKVNTVLPRQQGEEILRQLFALKNPFLCPHRRPIAFEISLEEIEKRLRRS